MSKNLSIKNVPDELVMRLRARAQRRHRSLQGELLVILEEAVRPERVTVGEIVEEVRGLGLRTGAEAAAMIRQDRDGR